jgi:sRNA-binding protein
VARGVLGVREVNAALKRYVSRLMYQKCLAAGGARVDLEGDVAGEVSSEQRCRAERLVAHIEARQLAETEAAKGKGAVRQAAAPPPCRTVRSSSGRRAPRRRSPPVAVVSGSLASSAQRRSGGRVRRQAWLMERWQTSSRDGGAVRDHGMTEPPLDRPELLIEDLDAKRTGVGITARRDAEE